MRTSKTLSTLGAVAVLAIGGAAPAAAAQGRHHHQRHDAAAAAARWQLECGHLGDTCDTAKAHPHRGAKAHSARKHHARKHHRRHHARRHHRRHHAKTHASSTAPRAHIALGYTGR